MAGTDATRRDVGEDGFAVVLVDPQLGDNIGAAARAMLNCGLTDLRLVRPRDGWPNERARAFASGADRVIDGTRVFERTEDAVRGLRTVYASTARDRFMVKPVVTPRQAALDMRAAATAGHATGVLFGGERAGLTNDDVALADTILTVSLNPAFSSLNLGQAVLVVAYEWFQAASDASPRAISDPDYTPADKADLYRLFDHLEGALEDARFFKTEEQKPSMIRSLRTMLGRGGFTQQEVRTLHGVITALSGRRADGRERATNRPVPDSP